MEDWESKFERGVMLFLLILSDVVTFLITCELLNRSWQNDAIQHHAAEYRCDSQSGKTTFVWLTKAENE